MLKYLLSIGQTTAMTCCNFVSVSRNYQCRTKCVQDNKNRSSFTVNGKNEAYVSLGVLDYHKPEYKCSNFLIFFNYIIFLLLERC